MSRPPTRAWPTARCGLHALVNGSLMSLDGQHAANVSGAFGRMGDQTGAALSRGGRQVASVVTLRRGARTWRVTVDR